MWVDYSFSVVIAWVLLLADDVFCKTWSVLLGVVSQLKFSAQFR